MPNDRDAAREQYRKTRAEFEKMEAQDKAAFVLEATFSTVGRALEETGRRIADVLEDAMEDVESAFRSARERPYPEQGPEPEAPPAARASGRRKAKEGERPPGETEE
ncbi:MAG: hypothetical protein R3362_10860 [Rhodothermales bacterium]|nr:hypothetical protein [Rhodothermales bacterium]